MTLTPSYVCTQKKWTVAKETLTAAVHHTTTPHHTIPCHTIPYHTIKYHTIPYHSSRNPRWTQKPCIPLFSGTILVLITVPPRKNTGSSSANGQRESGKALVAMPTLSYVASNLQPQRTRRFVTSRPEISQYQINQTGVSTSKSQFLPVRESFMLGASLG